MYLRMESAICEECALSRGFAFDSPVEGATQLRVGQHMEQTKADFSWR